MQTPLKLPRFDVKLKDHTIFCLIRKRWMVLTPEEWVRQHFLNLLITHLGYPRGMFKLEHTMSYFKNQKRSDIMVLDKNGDVFLLVECKSPEVKLDQKVVSQVAEYNKVLEAEYVAITNGMNHFVWQREMGDLKQIKDFPHYKT